MACTDNITDRLWGFEILNGNVSQMSIEDPLLDTQPRAQERAMSEFLKNAYAQILVTVTTHITTINLNDIVNVAGVPYLVKTISTTSDSVKTKVVLGFKRYE